MELKEMKNIFPPQQSQNPKTLNQILMSENLPKNQTEESKLLPTISADEEDKILSFLKSRVHGELSDVALKTLRSIYKGNTLEEVQAFAKIREEESKKIADEEKQKKFAVRQQKLQDLIRSAKVPKIFMNVRAKDFKMTVRNEHAAKIAISAINDNNGLFIYGECGTGKTMLASVIANERAENLKQSLFIGAVDVFHELNPYSSDSRTAANRKAVVKSSPCLIIDDLGAEKPSDWTKQTLFEIIDYRYRENLQTIITSNFNISELKTRLSEYEGSRIIRRIKSICSLVELEHY